MGEATGRCLSPLGLLVRLLLRPQARTHPPRASVQASGRVFNAAPQPKHVDFRRGLGPQARQMFETTGFQAHRLGDLHWLLSLPRESLCRVGSGRSELRGCLRSPVQTGGGECPFRLWLEQERNFAGQLARSLGKTAGTAGGLREALQPSGGDSAADPPPPSAHPPRARPTPRPGFREPRFILPWVGG